jgi:hypothetical protein
MDGSGDKPWATRSEGGVKKHILVIDTFPLKSAVETGKRFLEAEPLPDYIKRLGVFLEYGGKGITGYDLFEIEAGHEDEAIKVLTKHYTVYKDVEGFELQMKVVLTAVDALPMVGLSM